jgi:hypothetical protein
VRACLRIISGWPTSHPRSSHPGFCPALLQLCVLGFGFPFVVIRIGTGTDTSFSRAASLNSSITTVHPSSCSARCSRNCFGERTTGRPSHRLIEVGLKVCGGAAEITSTTLELRMDAKASRWNGSSRLTPLRRTYPIEGHLLAWKANSGARFLHPIAPKFSGRITLSD